jgi:hypothetical protein
MGIEEVYSVRNLTNPSDKLPALSTIASYFGNKMKDAYCAELWLKTLRE